MEFRQLGQSGLRIAPQVLGGNVFGWNVDAKTSFAILDAFVDAGFNAIDTADSYSRWAPGHVGGESETIIGKWLKASGKRNKVVIATKFGEDVAEGRSTRKIICSVPWQPRCAACRPTASTFTRRISTTR
jgi:aryl-alcohol dehydrogenase-like predicted oxidoreductase